MELVIRVDLDKAKQPLPEIFRLIGSRLRMEQALEDPMPGLTGRIEDNISHVIGEWEIEEAAETKGRPHSLEPAYRAAAVARYVVPRQIEVDRFATVSMANEGAYIQGWLFVPQAEVLHCGEEATPPAKPPQSVLPIRREETKAG
jgi:hypothetical protein